LIATADRLFRDGANPGATIQSLVQILEREPAHAKVWSYLGSIFLYLNDDVAAVAALHQALLLDAELIDARLNLAQAYSKTGARILARATYLDVLARLDAGQSAEFVKDARSEATTRLANINSHAPH
jgi:cytochrome c-type biogenesis protein CcmH/NrfG